MSAIYRSVLGESCERGIRSSRTCQYREIQQQMQQNIEYRGSSAPFMGDQVHIQPLNVQKLSREIVQDDSFAQLDVNQCWAELGAASLFAALIRCLLPLKKHISVPDTTSLTPSCAAVLLVTRQLRSFAASCESFTDSRLSAPQTGPCPCFQLVLFVIFSSDWDTVSKWGKVERVPKIAWYHSESCF